MVTFDNAFTEATVSQEISQLEEALATQRALAAGQKERLNRLKEAAGEEQARRSGLEEEISRLSAENDAARQELEAAIREGSDLQTGLAKDLAAARSQADEQCRQLDQAIEQASLELERHSRLQQEADSEAERFSFERDARQQRAERINEEHQSILARLGASLRQAEEQAGENINQALSKWETARIDHEAADSRLHLVRASLQDIETRLTETQQQLDEREQALRSLDEERESGLAELERRHAESSAAVAAERRQKEEELLKHQEDFRRLRGMAELSASALSSVNTRLDQLSQKLRDLYAKAEEETANASQKMSDAIHQVLSRREDLGGILQETNRLEEEAAAAETAKADLKDKLMLLQAENQDLSSAALVASDLAMEATAACKEAGPELLPTLKEMEEALLASAREAQAQARAKADELQETETNIERNAADLARLQDSREEAKQRLSQAESSCQDAEDSMLELSGRLGRLVSGRSEYFDRIKEARAEYDNAGKEQRTLKEAAAAAANDLRQAQLEDSRLRNALLQLEQKAARIDGEHQQGLNRLADNFKIRLAEAASALSISQDKQNRLLLSQSEKQSELEQATALLDQAERQEQELKEQLESCRARENAITEELQAQIDRQKEDCNQALAVANRDTDEAAGRLNEAKERISSLGAARDRIAEKIASLKDAKTAAKGDLVRKEEELQAAFDRSRDQVEERCASLSAQVSDIADRLLRHRDNAGFARKRAAASLAGTEAAVSAMAAIDRSIDADTGRLIQLRKVEAELQAVAAAEEEKRKAKEEEARLLREAEEKKQAEENARRLKELEEAAHAAALAEQARLAKERAERAAKFEEETALMASGRHLEREQLLELLDKGGLEERVQRINELAATAAQNTDFRYITDSEIEDMRGNAEFLTQQAAESAKEFESGRAVLASLKERCKLLENERRLIAPRLAAAMSQVEKAGHEYDAIASARNKLQTAGDADDEVSRALHDAGSGLERALEANRRQAASFEEELNGLQQQTAALEQQLEDTGKQYEEAADTIEEVTAKWLYKESAAAAARANVAEIERTADIREEFRRLKEAEAAARAQAKPGLKKLSPFIWRRNKRG